MITKSAVKWASAAALACWLAFGAAGAAFAHVTVQPAEVPQGSFQVFTVRVPSEKPSAATIAVKVEIPDGVDISRFEPKPGWTYETEKNGDGKIVSVTWKATGPGLSETEFGEFKMQGKVADDATELVWKAYQTYDNGEVVEWTGAADTDSPTPASVTKVTPAAGGDAHGHGSGGSGSAAGADKAEPARDPLTFGLAVASLAIAVMALVLALRGRRRA